MDKMSYPRGLIRYTSEHELDGGTTHWLRPRIIGYVAVLCIMTGVFWYNMLSRIPLELTAIRDRNQLYVTTDTGAIDNIYTLQLANMDRDPHEFVITISGIEGASIIGETSHSLDGGEVRSISIRVRAEPAILDKPSTELDFTVVATDRPSLQVTCESRFMKPL
jgi:polyferredoxin